MNVKCHNTVAAQCQRNTLHTFYPLVRVPETGGTVVVEQTVLLYKNCLPVAALKPQTSPIAPSMSVGSQTSSVCILLLLLCMLRSVRPSRKYIPSYIGPFLTIINRVEDCTPPASSRVNVKFSHYNPQRPYDKQWGWGEYTLGIPIDDEKSHISLVLDRWSNNQWKENFYIIRFTKNACTMCLDNMSVCRELFHQTVGKAGKEAKCSVSAGTYQLPNQTWEISFNNIRTLAYGRFRAKVKSSHLDHPNVTNCMAVTVDLIPKP